MTPGEYIHPSKCEDSRKAHMRPTFTAPLTIDTTSQAYMTVLALSHETCKTSKIHEDRQSKPWKVNKNLLAEHKMPPILMAVHHFSRKMVGVDPKLGKFSSAAL